MSLPTGLVLIVEDEPLIAMAIEDAVKEMGLTSRTAAGLSEALELAQLRDLQAPVVDVGLRGDSSGPLAAILRTRDIPFIVSTGSEAGRMPGASNGAPVLMKPYPDTELKNMLRHLIGEATTNVA